MEIASYLTDVYGPRLTYSNEYKHAADWAASKMKEWGLEGVHYEKWGPAGKGWTLKSFYAEVVEPRTIPVIAYPEAWSPSLKGTVKAEFTKPDSAFNIIGEIPGTDKKDEVVLIGGHFDSWHGGTSATDNAAGTSVCMEAMRLLKLLNLAPRRTIVIGLWAGEEEGLLGSRAYVDKHFGLSSENYNRPAAADNSTLTPEEKSEFNNFSVYFNDDNGTGKFRGIHLQGNEAAGQIFRTWLHEFIDPDAQTITISNTGGTDHLSFDNAGLPGFQFIQDPLDYNVRTHHSNMDVYDSKP